MARKKLTPEEKEVRERELNEKRLKENHERDYQELTEKLHLIPEPVYKYNIGDRVTIGNLKNVYVCGIFENGKIYEIDYSSENTNYGNPIITHHHKMYVNWVDIRPYHDDRKESIIKNNDLILNYSQRSMKDIFSKTYHFGINFKPDYQRDYVWQLEDKVALIDSIFNNIDIGKFVFIHKGYSVEYMYEILDGKQRIRAILDYYENRFPYKGLYFNDLSIRDQDHFEDYNISSAGISNVTREQVLRYFVKLNKHGKIMDKEQIEKVEKMIEEIKINSK